MTWITIGIVCWWIYSYRKNRGVARNPKYYRDKKAKVVDVKQYGKFIPNFSHKSWLEFNYRSKSIPMDNEIRFGVDKARKMYNCEIAAKVIVKKVGLFGYVHEWHIYGNNCSDSDFESVVNLLYQAYGTVMWSKP